MRSYRLVALAAAGLVAAALVADAVRADEVRKRDIRAARDAVLEGRWDAALEVYDAVLESAEADAEVRAEALYATSLGILATQVDGEGESEARRRLRELEAVPGHGRALELAAVQSLMDALDAERQGRSALESKLIAEQAAREADSLTAAEAVAAEQALRVDLEQRITSLERHLALAESQKTELAELFEAKQKELAEVNAGLDFLIAHLSEAQQDQAAMLDAVKEKNEELLAKERELQRTRVALHEREARLATQEEEVRKREAAIREVTERVLGKDESDQ
jgi:uncharacterized coiled-coil protein SlyX